MTLPILDQAYIPCMDNVRLVVIVYEGAFAFALLNQSLTLEKVERLVHEKSLSVRTALVFDGRLSPRVEADRFFDFVVPADRLFA